MHQGHRADSRSSVIPQPSDSGLHESPWTQMNVWIKSAAMVCHGPLALLPMLRVLTMNMDQREYPGQ